MKVEHGLVVIRADSRRFISLTFHNKLDQLFLIIWNSIVYLLNVNILYVTYFCIIGQCRCAIKTSKSKFLLLYSIWLILSYSFSLESKVLRSITNINRPLVTGCINISGSDLQG